MFSKYKTPTYMSGATEGEVLGGFSNKLIKKSLVVKQNLNEKTKYNS